MDANNTNKPYAATLYVLKHAFEHATLAPYNKKTTHKRKNELTRWILFKNG